MPIHPLSDLPQFNTIFVVDGADGLVEQPGVGSQLLDVEFCSILIASESGDTGAMTKVRFYRSSRRMGGQS